MRCGRRCCECSAPLVSNERHEASYCSDCERIVRAEYERTVDDDRWTYASSGIDGGVYFEGGE